MKLITKNTAIVIVLIAIGMIIPITYTQLDNPIEDKISFSTNSAVENPLSINSVAEDIGLIGVNPTKDIFDAMCANQLANGESQDEFICAVNIYEMRIWIGDLLTHNTNQETQIQNMNKLVSEISPVIGKVDELEKEFSDTKDEVNDLSGEIRFINMDMEEMTGEINTLKGVNANLTKNMVNMTSKFVDVERRLHNIESPNLNFTINVEPKSVSGRDEIRIFGIADQSKRDVVQINIFLPDHSDMLNLFNIEVKNNNKFERTISVGGKGWIVDGDYIVRGYHTYAETVLLSYTQNSTGT